MVKYWLVWIKNNLIECCSNNVVIVDWCCMVVVMFCNVIIWYLIIGFSVVLLLYIWLWLLGLYVFVYFCLEKFLNIIIGIIL